MVQINHFCMDSPARLDGSIVANLSPGSLFGLLPNLVPFRCQSDSQGCSTNATRASGAGYPHKKQPQFPSDGACTSIASTGSRTQFLMLRPGKEQGCILQATFSRVFSLGHSCASARATPVTRATAWAWAYRCAVHETLILVERTAIGQCRLIGNGPYSCLRCR